MESIKERVLVAYQYLTGLIDNDAFLEDIDWLTFLVTMAPIPGVQQMGQLANKIIFDKELKVKFDNIKHQTTEFNHRLAQIEDDVTKIGAIATTVGSVTKLEELVDSLIKEAISKIQTEQTEFIVDTRNWSTQTLIRQMIDVDWVKVSAVDNSRNELRNTQIKAKNTHLIAHNNSHNIIDGTDFSSDQGRVGMNSISQTGHVSIEGSSIGLYDGSSLILGPSYELKAICPICHTELGINKRDLIGKTSIQCPVCKTILPFSLKSK